MKDTLSALNRFGEKSTVTLTATDVKLELRKRLLSHIALNAGVFVKLVSESFSSMQSCKTGKTR